MSVGFQCIGDALLQLVHCLYLQLERGVAGEATVSFSGDGRACSSAMD